MVAIERLTRWLSTRERRRAGSATMTRQQTRAEYFRRYPFGQKQKAKVLAHGSRNKSLDVSLADGPVCVTPHIVRESRCINWRKFLDMASRPV